MVVIRKKRLLFSIYIVCISVLICFMQTLKQENLQAVVALPSTGKVVVVDAGHGKPDGGAVGVNGTLEADVNLQIALKVQKLLEQSGTTVILTRSDENGISELDNATLREKHRADLKNRANIGNEVDGDIFVSIHLNKIEQKSVTGWQSFYKKGNDESINLTNCLQKGLNEVMQKENRKEPAGISGIYIVENVKIPISIVECGFLSNSEEERLLNTDEYQTKLAWGIYIGIIEYFYSI